MTQEKEHDFNSNELFPFQNSFKHLTGKCVVIITFLSFERLVQRVFCNNNNNNNNINFNVYNYYYYLYFYILINYVMFYCSRSIELTAWIVNAVQMEHAFVILQNKNNYAIKC